MQKKCAGKIGSVSSNVEDADQVRGRLQSQADKNAENANASHKVGQVAKNVPGLGKPRMFSLLMVRDTNARAGSRSSVSSQDRDRFFTASQGVGGQALRQLQEDQGVQEHEEVLRKAPG